MIIFLLDGFTVAREIQGKSILVRVSASFQLLRVLVTRSKVLSDSLTALKIKIKNKNENKTKKKTNKQTAKFEELKISVSN